MSQHNSQANLIVKRRILLGKIGTTENWLNNMANNGKILTRVEGNCFYFSVREPEKLHFFMLSPEVGANNSSWIYYEFLENGGIKVPHSGSNFMSPNLILKISDNRYQENSLLYRYYFQHRNYRMLHRFALNISMSAVMLVGSSLLILADKNYFFSLLYILLGSFGIGCLNIVMLLEFCQYIKSAGFLIPWKRPRRPGY